MGKVNGAQEEDKDQYLQIARYQKGWKSIITNAAIYAPEKEEAYVFHL